MFNVIKGFQSQAERRVTEKHAKRFILISISMIVGILIARLYNGHQPLYEVTFENIGFFIGISLLATRDYLKEITALRNNTEDEKA